MGASCSTQSNRRDVIQPNALFAPDQLSQCDGMIDDERLQDAEPHAPPANYQKRRRTSVCAEVTTTSVSLPYGLQAMHLPVVPKSDEVKASIKATLQHSFVFRGLDEEQERAIINCMFKRNVSASEMIIREGEEGDNCYVVESGTFVACKVQKQVCQYDSCGAFGELALLYNSPRAASVQAITNGVLWGVDRASFREVMVACTAAKRERFESTLLEMPLFSTLSAEQRAVIADCLEAESYDMGDYVLQEGDPVGSDAKFYLVQSGTVCCLKSYQGTKRAVADVQAGGFFGELGLVTSTPRAADCVVNTDKANLLSMGRDAFQRLLGPVEGVLAARVLEYADVNQHKLLPSNCDLGIAATG